MISFKKSNKINSIYFDLVNVNAIIVKLTD
jgi:hypothetical protein